MLNDAVKQLRRQSRDRTRQIRCFRNASEKIAGLGPLFPRVVTPPDGRVVL
jgi:hypothetical protein